MPEIAVHFEHSRTTEGDDIAGLLRENWPDADIAADLDGDGAVTGYTLTLTYEDGDRAVEAAFRLAEFFRGEGLEYVVADDA